MMMLFVYALKLMMNIMCNLKKNDIVELLIEDINNLGAGVSHLDDGRVIFVRGAVTGDKIKAKIIKINTSISPTTDAVDTKFVTPFLITFSTPEKVNVSLPLLRSINAVYGALAISNTYRNIGFANQIKTANKQLRRINDQGFSASVIGPPSERNNCQTVIRNNIVQAMYCITVKAFATNGK